MFGLLLCQFVWHFDVAPNYICGGWAGWKKSLHKKLLYFAITTHSESILLCPYFIFTFLESLFNCLSPQYSFKWVRDIIPFVLQISVGAFRSLEKDIHSDVTFIVHGYKIHAHRCILSARCAYFADMFQKKWKDRKNIHLTNRLVSFRFTIKASNQQTGMF